MLDSVVICALRHAVDAGVGVLGRARSGAPVIGQVGSRQEILCDCGGWRHRRASLCRLAIHVEVIRPGVVHLGVC